jgi:hypothetical protein
MHKTLFKISVYDEKDKCELYEVRLVLGKTQRDNLTYNFILCNQKDLTQSVDLDEDTVLILEKFRS